VRTDALALCPQILQALRVAPHLRAVPAMLLLDRVLEGAGPAEGLLWGQ
jgi:hypothetical protein